MNEQHISNIEKSLFYSLFKSSMENTHTDFWSGIVKQYGIDAIRLFGIEPKEGEKLEDVRREYLRFDLYIETNQRVIVIENKIKTAYTDEQLEKYTEKLSKKCKKEVIKRLVTFFEDPEVLPEGWLALRYTDISDNLKSLNFDHPLVPEYKYILENLNAIFTGFEISDKKYEIGYSDKVNQLKTISFDDIYKKYKAQQFEKYLKENLNKDGHYYIDSYFVSGQGAVDIRVANINGKEGKEAILLGITLQGDKYKRSVAIGTKTDFYKEHKLPDENNISSKCLEDIKWLELSEKEKENSSLRDKSDYNTFGLKEQFNTLYKYRHFNINENIFGDLSYERICEYIKNDIANFEKQRPEIQELLIGK